MITKAMDSYKLLQLDRAYYLADDNVILFSVPKAAGTSIRARALELSGANIDEILLTTPHPEIGWDQAIWSQHLPPGLTLGSMSEQRVNNLLSDPAIKRLAVVRDPVSRIWSSWVSKVLLGEPMYRNLRNQLLSPKWENRLTLGLTASELAIVFEEFLEHLSRNRELLEDSHFTPQFWFLRSFIGTISFIDVQHLDVELPRLAQNFFGSGAFAKRNVTQNFVKGPRLTLKSLELILQIYSEDVRLGQLDFSEVCNSYLLDPSHGEDSVLTSDFFLFTRATARLDAVLKIRDSLAARAKFFENQTQELSHQVSSAEAQIRALLTSRSWRASAPLRAVTSVIKGVVGSKAKTRE